MELVDILDENGQPTGVFKDKDEAHRYGLWHNEVHVWIINDNNEFLMQKRSPNKKFNPNKWSICAGHVKAGESMVEAAARELEEEVGIKLSQDEFRFMFTYKSENVENIGTLINNCFEYVYIVKINKDISEFKIQEDEVSEIRFMPCEEVRQKSLIRSNEFSLRDDEYIRMLFYLLK